MSFFDPANMFGGGGSRVRDPLGLFGGGRRQMNPQEIAQAQGGGGQSQRANAFGGGFGGTSGFRGQGLQESDFGGPAEMAAPAPQAQPMMGGFGKPAPMQGGPNPAAMMQSQGQWGQLATALAQQQPRAQPQGISGGLQQFANMNLQRSADPYANARSVFAQVRSSGRGKFADPRG